MSIDVYKRQEFVREGDFVVAIKTVDYRKIDTEFVKNICLGNLEQGRRHGGAQNAEHQGNGGGRGKAEGIEGCLLYTSRCV